MLEAGNNNFFRSIPASWKIPNWRNYARHAGTKANDEGLDRIGRKELKVLQRGSGTVATQGWFNHYDDPDEFWDEEPLDPPSPVKHDRDGRSPDEEVEAASYRTLPDSAATPRINDRDMSTDSTAGWSADSSTVKSRKKPTPRESRFVAMKLDGGFLPVEIDFSRSWDRHVGPYEAGDELMIAYRSAASDRLTSVYSAIRKPTPQEVSETATPDKRTIMSILLETTSWAEYVERFDALISSPEYRVDGYPTTLGGNSVTMHADRTYIQAILVDPSWVASTGTHRLAEEIVWCANQIRSLRPRFAPSRDYSNYSEEDLEYHLDQHRAYLINGKV